MIDFIVLQRIEEGLRTKQKVSLPAEYHVRADYIKVLQSKGWGRGQIGFVTGWNVPPEQENPSAYITQARRVVTEAIPAGTEIYGTPKARPTLRYDGVAICAGPLKIIVEGSPETIIDLAERLIESARFMQTEDQLQDSGV